MLNHNPIILKMAGCCIALTNVIKWSHCPFHNELLPSFKERVFPTPVGPVSVSVIEGGVLHGPRAACG